MCTFKWKEHEYEGLGFCEANSSRPQKTASQTTQRMNTAETERDAQTALVLSGEEIGARDKAPRQGTVFSLFETSCHHH